MNPDFLILSLSVFAVSFLVTFFLTPLVRKYSVTRKLFDKRTSRKVHQKVITRLGGAAIFAGIFLGLLPVYSSGILHHQITVLFAGTGIVFAIGILDDIRGVPPFAKMLVQLAAGVIIVVNGFCITNLTIPFGGEIIQLPTLVSWLLTLGWILFITNSINFLDGLDGLASGIVAIACLFLFILSLKMGRFDSAILFLAVGGSCLAFLRYNYYPAKLFMGDSGSMTLGFTFACISLFGLLKTPATFSLLTPILILSVPVSDTFSSVIRRMRRKGLFTPDREHFHHRLIKSGFRHEKAVILLYCIGFAAGLISFIFSPHFSFTAKIFSLGGVGSMLFLTRLIILRRH